jgi:hypothetical protein
MTESEFDRLAGGFSALGRVLVSGIEGSKMYRISSWIRYELWSGQASESDNATGRTLSAEPIYDGKFMI